MQNPQKELKNVLFVDDDQSYLRMVEKVFGLWSKGTWEISKVDTLSQALPFMEKTRVHLVVVDSYVPGKDGSNQLRALHKSFPSIPKIVLTDNPNGADRKECLANGALRYLEKPKTMEGMEGVFKLLDELAKSQPEGGFTGKMAVTGLQEILQMECLNRSSSILEFSSGRYSGRVFIQTGAIIHAEAAHFTGTVALSFLLALKGGEFEVKAFSAPPEVTITGSWENLLMEAAQTSDEQGNTFFKTKSEMAAAAPAVREDSDAVIAPEDMRVPSQFRETLTLKTRVVSDSLGLFEKLQIFTENSRMVAELDGNDSYVSNYSQKAAAGLKAELKEKINVWLVQKKCPVHVLAVGVMYPDESSLILSQHFNSRSLGKIYTALSETAHEMAMLKMPTSYLRWNFETAWVFGSARKDGIFLALLTNCAITSEEVQQAREILTDFEGL